MWQSWPQACMTPSFSLANGSPVRSVTASAGLFVQGQRVDVGAEQDGPAGRRSAEGGDEAAVIGEGLDIVAEGPELLSDAGSGGFFLEGKLTVPVEMAAHLLNVGGELFRFVFESHGDSFL